MKVSKWGLGALGLVAAGGIAVAALGIGAAVSAQEPPPDESGKPRLERPAREKVREHIKNHHPRLHRALRGVFRSAAEVIGIEPGQLREGLKAGKSLTAIAAENGMPREELETELFSALSTRLTQAVADGKISEERKTELLNGLSERMDNIIDSTREDRRAARETLRGDK